MALFDNDFIQFLLRAKRATYAGGDQGQVASSRTVSHDLAYREGQFAYLDTYLGGFAFIGEEAVWQAEKPVWGMNYYGTMTTDEIPPGFSDFLKLALRSAPVEAPYRGPASLVEGSFAYICQWEGTLEMFRGQEEIMQDGHFIYRLYFHGGKIV
jgi:hypothetical protein